MILTALFKIVYTPWMDRYFTINNVPVLLIILKENHGVRSYDSKNTDTGFLSGFYRKRVSVIIGRPFGGAK